MAVAEKLWCRSNAFFAVGLEITIGDIGAARRQRGLRRRSVGLGVRGLGGGACCLALVILRFFNGFMLRNVAALRARSLADSGLLFINFCTASSLYLSFRSRLPCRLRSPRCVCVFFFRLIELRAVEYGAEPRMSMQQATVLRVRAAVLAVFSAIFFAVAFLRRHVNREFVGLHYKTQNSPKCSKPNSKNGCKMRFRFPKNNKDP